MEFQKKTLGDLLLVEVHRGWSRQNVTLATQAGAAVALGTVLGQVTASGKYTLLAPAANDGSETAAAVLIDDFAAVSTDVEAVVLKRGAVVNVAALVWPAGITDAQKAAALAALEVPGIVAKTVL